MAKRRNRYKNNNNKPNNRHHIRHRKPKKNLLASAVIENPEDTNILQEDLFREFYSDKANTDQGLLINDKWVRFFDQRSSFLKGMMALVSNSTTTRNVIGKKTSLTLGDGFIPVALDAVPFLQTLRKKITGALTVQDKKIDEVNLLIGNVNFNNETLEQVIEKVAFDWWAFGNAMVELVRTTRDGEPIVMMYHIPLEQAAIKKANGNNIIDAIGVNKCWEHDSYDESTTREIPLYPTFEDDRSAIHIKNYAPGFFYWGLPENVAARFWAEIEYRIPKYNIAKFKNSFKPSAIIQTYGSFTEEEAEELVESFKSLYTDTDNNDELLVQVLRRKEDKADITVLEDKTEGNYMELQKLATQAIVTGNQFTMSLTGLATSGKLGSNQQIRDELEYVQNTTITQAQRLITQSIINPFMKENAEVNSGVSGVMLAIAKMNPISLRGQLEPNDILTNNEKREVFGYEPQEETEANNNQDNQPQEQ